MKIIVYLFPLLMLMGCSESRVLPLFKGVWSGSCKFCTHKYRFNKNNTFRATGRMINGQRTKIYGTFLVKNDSIKIVYEKYRYLLKPWESYSDNGSENFAKLINDTLYFYSINIDTKDCKLDKKFTIGDYREKQKIRKRKNGYPYF